MRSKDLLRELDLVAPREINRLPSQSRVDLPNLFAAREAALGPRLPSPTSASTEAIGG